MIAFFAGLVGAAIAAVATMLVQARNTTAARRERITLAVVDALTTSRAVTRTAAYVRDGRIKVGVDTDPAKLDPYRDDLAKLSEAEYTIKLLTDDPDVLASLKSFRTAIDLLVVNSLGALANEEDWDTTRREFWDAHTALTSAARQELGRGRLPLQ